MKFIIPPSQKQNTQLFSYNRENGAYNTPNENNTDDKDCDNIIISYDANNDTRNVKLWVCDPSFTNLNNLNESSKSNKCSCKIRPHYVLYVHVDGTDEELINKYANNFSAMRDKVNKYRFNNSKDCIDAGIDIFTNDSIVAVAGEKCKVKTGLRCAMYFVDGTGELMPSGFYMYPRSSTGSSTPLRLANSVGIIDAGYRGELMGFFDNRDPTGSEYVIQKYQRLLQICSPNLTYPIYPVLVENIGMLELFSAENKRGAGGFGSTGV